MDAQKTALIFPGQGSQIPGMGRELADQYPVAREIFERADEVLGRSISGVCFDGDEAALRETSNTQPALYVTSAAALEALNFEGIDGAFAAGHSLGEYTALFAAGVFDFEAGLRLVELRGQAMADAADAKPGTMAALLGMELDAVEAVCDAAAEAGIVVPANFNAPGQIVISGEVAAVEKAIELAKQAGCRRAMALNVGGAFHSPLMSPAVQRLQAALADVELSEPKLQVVSNVDAMLLPDAESVRWKLAVQLSSCVLWSDCITTLAQSGATYFIEVGPGKVLSGLMKRIDKSLKCANFSSPNDIVPIRAAD